MKRQRDQTGDLKLILKGVFVYMPASLVIVIGGFMLQYEYLDPNPAFRAVTEAAPRAGYVILIAAATVLVMDLAAIVTYMIRQGTRDDSEGSVIEEGPLPMELGMGAGRSKRKILYKRNDFISMNSLVAGTATFGERMMVLGFFVLVTSFLSIFVGIGLMMMKGLLILGLFVPVIPGVFVYRILRAAWSDYREAKTVLKTSRSHSAARTNR